MSRPINNNNDLFQLFSEMINNRQNSYFNNLNRTDIETLYRRVLSLSDSEREHIVDNAIFNLSLSDFLPPDWTGKQYSRDEYELAENHFDNLRESFMEDTEMKVDEYDYRLTKEVKNSVLELYYDTDAYELPDIDQIIDNLFEDRCNCVREYPHNYVKKVIKQCILYTGGIPSCELYPQYIEYYVLHGRIPTDEELEEFIRRVIEYSRNPEEFHQKDKEFVPALNIDLLPVDKYVKLEEDEACCICQEDFCEEQEVITLLPCKHKFHNKSEECLEGGSVLTWLEKYNYCPMCKTKVNALGD
jgi:CRISPR/Cas system-associated endoribonuclease Cas2